MEFTNTFSKIFMLALVVLDVGGKCRTAVKTYNLKGITTTRPLASWEASLGTVWEYDN